MLTTRGNIHRSRLPRPGAVGYLTDGEDPYLGPRYYLGRRERWIAESFPLCDNVWPWSIGIHTAWFRRLRDGHRARLSGFYFEEAA